MCAIGQNQTLSVASSVPNSTMLGGAAVGSAPAGPGAKRVMGGVGTLLGGAGGASGGSSSTTPRTGGGGRDFKMLAD